jgi:hypothetical protein
LSKAQTSDAKLEGLETLIELGQIDLPKAAIQYTQYISEIPFVTDHREKLLKKRLFIDLVKGEITAPAPNHRVEKRSTVQVGLKGLVLDVIYGLLLKQMVSFGPRKGKSLLKKMVPGKRRSTRKEQLVLAGSLVWMDSPGK